LTSKRIEFATAFAPASVGNVAVGFDVLGHALTGLGDRVSVHRSDEPGVRIVSICGSDAELPLDPADNTAGSAVAALLAACAVRDGMEIRIAKGIPMSSGLGGSAASAVAATVAAAAIVDPGRPLESLYPFALAGEAVASGAAHGDNVGPQLLGGLVLATASRLVRIPVPPELTAVAVHPSHRIDTRDARACLNKPFPLNVVVAQTGNLAQLLCGCHHNDFELIAAGLRDVMIEPRRADLIPGFAQVREAALDNDALGAAISGVGPTVCGWFRGIETAERAGTAMVRAFAAAGLPARAHISPVNAPGAKLLESG
jgi:homoserine kinase